ncbi:hypothetical protein FB45DRAFT_1031929 [Roridomyces roridus]|uniref:Uncharacterized protein n=1 Tax=Roridomyces roridus TaxID=1738132 RepID=A0AAD7FG52_9AGAR|nr:hypothetical protein FB45DRAFT_1031929 [Roridomyces roridus]
MSLSSAALQELIPLIIGRIGLWEDGQEALPTGFPWADATLTWHNFHPAARFNPYNIVLQHLIRTEDSSLIWRIVVAGQSMRPVFEIPASIWSHASRPLAIDASFVLAGIRLSLQANNRRGAPISVRVRLAPQQLIEWFDYVDLRSGEKVKSGVCKPLRMCKAPTAPPYVCPVLLHRPGPNLEHAPSSIPDSCMLIDSPPASLLSVYLSRQSGIAL